jgi:hypothetical protein
MMAPRKTAPLKERAEIMLAPSAWGLLMLIRQYLQFSAVICRNHLQSSSIICN